MLALIRRRKIAYEVAQTRRDPAPSRWSYRYQRLMLTPLFRLFMRAGAPFLVSFIFGYSVLALPPVRLWLNNSWTGAVTYVASRPEFTVTGYAIDGAGGDLSEAINTLVTTPFPISSFDLDVQTLQEQIAALSAVRSATVSIQNGGKMMITVDERKPVAIWRHTDGLRLIDDEGFPTGMLNARSDRSDLPLIGGDGAYESIEEALELFRVAGPVRARVLALTRIGERRWDMLLDRDQRIMLPAKGAVSALAQVVALESTQKVLSRDVAVVDMRNSARPTLRLGASTLEARRPQEDTQ